MVATLQVENLETHFPSRDGIVRAVDGVSFAIEPGEILGDAGVGPGDGGFEGGCGVKRVTEKPRLEFKRP